MTPVKRFVTITAETGRVEVPGPDGGEFYELTPERVAWLAEHRFNSFCWRGTHVALRYEVFITDGSRESTASITVCCFCHTRLS